MSSSGADRLAAQTRDPMVINLTANSPPRAGPSSSTATPSSQNASQSSAAQTFFDAGSAQASSSGGAGGFDTHASSGDGLIGRVRAILQGRSAGLSGHAFKAWVIDGPILHFSSGRTQTCGYRCTQMLLSHVLACDTAAGWPGARGRIGPETPSVDSLRETLEAAWSGGYDPAGAEQLQHSTLKRRRGCGVLGATPSIRWIGATEMWVICSSLGLRVQVVDFGSPRAYDLPPVR